MNLTAITPILNVQDIGRSIEWFVSLGWKRCWTYNDGGMIAEGLDQNEFGVANFASIGSGECEIFLCRDGQGSRGGPLPRHLVDDDTGGVWMTWWLKTAPEVDAVYELAVRNSMATHGAPLDEPWGIREFRLVHPDGHTFRVSAPSHRV
jgi:uncharacterized glyoxalase superfamily protein PhnB